jgi:hypothetical protein
VRIVITTEASTVSVTLMLPTNEPTVLTATANVAVAASAGTGPIHAHGEEVTDVRVAANFGRPSSVSYLIRSGREIVVP